MGKLSNNAGKRRQRGNVLQRNKKALLLGGGALALALGGYKLMNLSQLNNELQISQAVQLHKVGLTELTLRIDVILKNPTPGSIRVKTPHITISYNGEQIAGSDNVNGANHTVPPYGQVQLDPIMISMGYLAMAFNFKSFWEEYRATGRATVSVRALTRINDVFPVEKTTTFNLGSTAPAQKSGAGLAGLLPDSLRFSDKPVAYVPKRREHTRRQSS